MAEEAATEALRRKFCREIFLPLDSVFFLRRLTRDAIGIEVRDYVGATMISIEAAPNGLEEALEILKERIVSFRKHCALWYSGDQDSVF